MWVPSKLFLRAVQAALSGTAAEVLTGTYLGLFTDATPTLTPDSLIGALVTPGYTGYARQALVWSDPFYPGSRGAVIQAEGLVFTPTDALGVASTVVGAFVASAVTSGVLYLSMRFAGSGIGMSTTDDLIQLIAEFVLPQAADYGGVILAD